MDLSVVYSRASVGLEAPLVQVETHLANGLPAFNIVGLPETAVRESKDRVRCALLNSNFEFPDRRITVNLAPAELPKEGGRFDLPIALSILAASGQLPDDTLERHEFLGELALDGHLRPSPAVIPAAQACTESGRALVVAPACAPLAAHVPGSRVLTADHLLDLCAHLNGRAPLSPCAPGDDGLAPPHYPDLNEVAGQPLACRALEVAACGGHNLLLSGPPGTGKTLLASRLPGILPPLTAEQALTNAALQNFYHHNPGNIRRRPFRQPHHTASAAALVGGGGRPRPGEISLAHGGVLFLDELPEFSRHVLEVLREPLESGEITLSRASHKFTFPARFQLVAAMNPCPCGYLGDPERACRCTTDQIHRYSQRISGPLLDRIDLQVGMPRVSAAVILRGEQRAEDSATVRQRVAWCRERQQLRQHCTNAELASERLMVVCRLEPAERRQLEQAADRMQLSVRALHRSLRVARTLADMAGATRVDEGHIAEALAYRAQDGEYSVG
ncbi:YifB family Mg chelatase-like AAA ATPase [Parahaliea mediterranea]|uniref:YifB family Mg chelatase-like AAA ATPase n=1 Tax=Parahaliea mediterranea TaxID=651086 RepID=A0A939ILB9_9GAMM|nr:YifB family Mg chelatase-like AAA ATPase [Parahaliea mediterranea]MBN7798226.1 YifB family Mg chelatase-like AAA ATPase [Parahaliea mediterranea]